MTSQLRSIIIVVGVVLIVGGVAYLRSGVKNGTGAQGATGVTDHSPSPVASMPAGAGSDTETADSIQITALPRVVDLGAKACIPCKQMAPILAELKIELAGKAQVEFIDIQEDRKAVAHYSIRAMPTQVFFDRGGREIWRHEGFLPKADNLAKLHEAGMN